VAGGGARRQKRGALRAVWAAAEAAAGFARGEGAARRFACALSLLFMLVTWLPRGETAFFAPCAAPWSPEAGRRAASGRLLRLLAHQRHFRPF